MNVPSPDRPTAPAIKVSQGVAPSAHAVATQSALRQAVSEALDRKRRLGHYAVIWQDGRAVDVPADALPAGASAAETPSH